MRSQGCDDLRTTCWDSSGEQHEAPAVQGSHAGCVPMGCRTVQRGCLSREWLAACTQGGVPGVNLAVAPIDDNTKLALQVAVALLGVVGVGVGAPADQLSSLAYRWLAGVPACLGHCPPCVSLLGLHEALDLHFHGAAPLGQGRFLLARDQT